MDALKLIAQDSLKTGEEIPQIKIGDTVHPMKTARERPFHGICSRHSD